MNFDKNEWLLVILLLFSEGCWGFGCGICVGGMWFCWMVVEKRWKGLFNMLVRYLLGLFIIVIVKWLMYMDLLLMWKFFICIFVFYVDFDVFF